MVAMDTAGLLGAPSPPVGVVMNACLEERYYVFRTWAPHE